MAGAIVALALAGFGVARLNQPSGDSERLLGVVIQVHESPAGGRQRGRPPMAFIRLKDGTVTTCDVPHGVRNGDTQVVYKRARPYFGGPDYSC